ncbi:Histone deacetylase domain [Trypanosoma vivax]|nr:histone deacetylase [Trypanosoma vivax]KAH8608025.1 Histone deacetylase domain [Trypanosoma vivax]
MPKRRSCTVSAVGNSKQLKKVKVDNEVQNLPTKQEEAASSDPLTHKEELQRVKLERCIQEWMQDAQETPMSKQADVPTIAPLPTILDMMMPLTVPPGTASHLAGAATAGKCAPAVSGTGVVYDEVMLEHKSSEKNDYERPGRLQRTLAHLEAIGLLSCCRRIPQRAARTKELRLVHSSEHIDSVDQLEVVAMLREPGESSSVGQDLYANSSTPKAARVAAGCVIAAARSVVRDEVRNAFALVRPPGHHASATSASGFCFFNNVAVAVRVAQQELMQKMGQGSADKPRVLVVDWDVHHCDGTESIFYEDESVVVISMHQYGSGRGHVLRKMPTVFCDPINVEELATLMDCDAGGAMAGIVLASDAGGAEGTHETDLGVVGSNLNASAAVSGVVSGPGGKGGKESALEEGSPARSSEIGGKTRTTRQRKPVDYNKLAAEMKERDEEVAQMFGLDPEEIARSSTSSSTTDSRCSSSTVRGRDTAKLPGDSEGVSFEEKINSDSDAPPFYPGTGHMGRVGGDEQAVARGKNINIPWPTVGMGDLEYLHVLSSIVLPVVREFDPEVVFVSCGFDAAAGDLLGSMQVSISGYYLMVKTLAAVCPRLVVALEGGYNLSNVARGSEAVMRALLESSGCATLPRSSMLWCQAEEVIQQVRNSHKDYWRCFSIEQESQT